MNGDDWAQEAHRRLGRDAHLFKPKEIQVIIDFIETAKDDSVKEGK